MFPSAERIRRSLCHLSLALVLFAGSAITDAVADGRICTTADTFIFGNQAVGSSTTANATVTNCGDAPWSFTDVSVDPATGPAFQVSTTCTTGLALTPGGTCAVDVQFAPTTTGQTSGGLWLHNTTTTPDQLITFYGRGVDAQSGSASLTFVPATADFACQAVGTQSAPLTLELHNQGPAALTPSAMVLNGPAVYDFFGYDDTCKVGASIAAGGSCHMTLYFRPQAAGIRLANLVIDAPQLASLAIMQISGIATTTTTSKVQVIEFYNASLDHYFISINPQEISDLDSGVHPGWTRTGLTFNAYAAATSATNPVCRFYIPPQHGDSHFYSADPNECTAVLQKTMTDPNYSGYVYEAPNVFYIGLPDTTTGACPAGTIPVFRLWNHRADSNHRYTTDASVRAQMISQGYIAEGYGPSATIMCAPQ
ncbi:MAG: choice-of-anchor D domain-containing protein [Casimicrobiaceae bacterium]